MFTAFESLVVVYWERLLKFFPILLSFVLRKLFHPFLRFGIVYDRLCRMLLLHRHSIQSFHWVFLLLIFLRHFYWDTIYLYWVLWLQLLLQHLFFFWAILSFSSSYGSWHRFLWSLHRGLLCYWLLVLRLFLILARGIDWLFLLLVFILIFIEFKAFLWVFLTAILFLAVELHCLFRIKAVILFCQVLLDFFSKVLIFFCSCMLRWGQVLPKAVFEWHADL